MLPSELAIELGERHRLALAHLLERLLHRLEGLDVLDQLPEQPARAGIVDGQRRAIVDAQLERPAGEVRLVDVARGARWVARPRQVRLDLQHRSLLLLDGPSIAPRAARPPGGGPMKIT